MKVRELRALLDTIEPDRGIRFVVDIRSDSDPNRFEIQTSDVVSNRGRVVGAFGRDLDGALVVNVNFIKP